MYSPEDLIELSRMLSDAERVCVITHTRPDGDAVGSSLGMRHFISDCIGKKATVLFPDPWPEQTGFLFGKVDKESSLLFSENPSLTKESIEKSDLLIFLDLNAYSRTGDEFSAMLEEVASSKKKILFDHHLNPERERFNLVFSNTEISSASELEYQVISQLSEFKKMTVEGLTAILCGITTDTNNFANSVYPSTLKACSDLLSKGVDRDMVLGHLYHEYKENRVRLMGMLLSQRMKITSEGAAVIILNEDEYKGYGMEQGDLEGLVNVPLSIGKVRMSVYLRECGDLYYVSIRSKKGTSANTFAGRYFHGGGHENASGGKLLVPGDIASKSDTERFVCDAISEFFKKEESK